MTPIKIIVTLFILFTFSRVIFRFKEKNLGKLALLFWTLIWSSTLIIVYFPQSTDYFANFLGIQRGTDTMFFLSMLLNFYLIFRLYIKLDNLDKDITALNKNLTKELQSPKKFSNFNK